MAQPHVEDKLDMATPAAESRGTAVCPVILHGDPLTDRKSTFLAHGSKVKTTEEVSELLKQYLRSNFETFTDIVH